LNAIKRILQVLNGILHRNSYIRLSNSFIAPWTGLLKIVKICGCTHIANLYNSAFLFRAKNESMSLALSQGHFRSAGIFLLYPKSASVFETQFNRDYKRKFLHFWNALALEQDSWIVFALNKKAELYKFAMWVHPQILTILGGLFKVHKAVWEPNIAIFDVKFHLALVNPFNCIQKNIREFKYAFCIYNNISINLATLWKVLHELMVYGDWQWQC